MLYDKEWILINKLTERMELPNGWLVKTWENNAMTGEVSCCAMCYVHDPDKDWLVEAGE